LTKQNQNRKLTAQQPTRSAMNIPICTMCLSENVGILGCLGNLAHLLCRQCGWQMATLVTGLEIEGDNE
jgi:hypothetical protein